MKTMRLALTFAALFCSSRSFGQTKEYELVMSLNDRFVVKGSNKWNVTVDKLLPLRFANVQVSPRDGRSFSLMLYFKCDTPDLGRFDSPEKMRSSVVASSEEYLPYSVEKRVVVKELRVRGWYGFSTVLTDRDLSEKKEIPAGSFKYITRGMVRLSPDSALGFSLMTNELDSSGYKELMDHILHFVKAKE